MNVRSYFRQVAVLLFGNVAAQLINLASYPVLTRLYSPGDFGGFAVFVTVVGILGPVACARFDLIIQSSKDWQLPAVFRQALRMNVMVSIAAAGGTALYALVIGDLGLELALLVGGGVWLTGYTLAALALLVRQERYPLYSKSLVGRSLLTAGAQIGLWFLIPGALGLILGFCAGFALQAVVLARALMSVRWRRTAAAHRRAVVGRYRRQVLTDIPSTLLAATALNIMNVLVLDLYSRDDVGFYSLAFRVAILPLALITGSLSEVFYQSASASFRATGAFWNEVRLNVLSTAAISLLIFVPMALLSRPVFAFAFGEQWIPAADLLALLTPMLAVRFVAASVQTAPLVVGRANWLLTQHIGLAAVLIGAYVAARQLSLPIQSYVLLNSMLMAAVYALYVGAVATIIRRRYRSIG